MLSTFDGFGGWGRFGLNAGGIAIWYICRIGFILPKLDIRVVSVAPVDGGVKVSSHVTVTRGVRKHWRKKKNKNPTTDQQCNLATNGDCAGKMCGPATVADLSTGIKIDEFPPFSPMLVHTIRIMSLVIPQCHNVQRFPLHSGGTGGSFSPSLPPEDRLNMTYPVEGRLGGFWFEMTETEINSNIHFHIIGAVARVVRCFVPCKASEGGSILCPHAWGWRTI